MSSADKDRTFVRIVSLIIKSGQRILYIDSCMGFDQKRERNETIKLVGTIKPHLYKFEKNIPKSKNTDKSFPAMGFDTTLDKKLSFFKLKKTQC